ncbi:hypothetical protein ASF48_05775 [Rathayibacter sp. Leaf299]|nr:hypothetical protein ASF48_05775 [Rathayibacter sp. Leaf299]
MDEQRVKLIIGVVAVVVAVILIIERKAYARWNARMIRRTWGADSKRYASAQTPGSVLVTGIGLAFIGVVFVVTSIASLTG